MTAIDPDVLVEIANERQAQDDQWGGPDHDDAHNLVGWMDYVSHQIEKFALPKHS